MIIVSACLAGIECRYDGKSFTSDFVKELLISGRAVALCPELLGGLSAPRPSCENINGEVLDKEGNDYTKEFLTGAEKTLEIAKILNCKKAILKSKSPSCGFGKIYDGTFSGTVIYGNGITADLLSKHGIEIQNEDNYIP